MIWKLDCRKTRRHLALQAGNDVEGADLGRTERHLSICPSCREVWQGLRAAQQALEQSRPAGSAPRLEVGVDDATATLGPPSIWPGVARHIRAIDEQASVPNWRGWLPAGALAAACLAIIVVTLPDSQFSGSMADQHKASIIFSPLEDSRQVMPVGMHRDGAGRNIDIRGRSGEPHDLRSF